MKKYTNKILVTTGIVLVLVFAITFFLTFRELKSSGRLTTYKELSLSTDTSNTKGTCGTHTVIIAVDENGNAEVQEEE